MPCGMTREQCPTLRGIAIAANGLRLIALCPPRCQTVYIANSLYTQVPNENEHCH